MPDILDPGGTYEYGTVERVAKHWYLKIGFEAIHLTTEGVPPHMDIYSGKGVTIKYSGSSLTQSCIVEVRDDLDYGGFGQQDHTGAGSQDGKTISDHPLQGDIEPIKLHESADGGTLTARNHQPIHPLKFLR